MDCDRPTLRADSYGDIDVVEYGDLEVAYIRRGHAIDECTGRMRVIRGEAPE